MNKFRYFSFLVLSFLLFSLISAKTIYAKENLAYEEFKNIYDEVYGVIRIEEDGKITIGYKYGLKEAGLYYCKKGVECDTYNYSYKLIVSASEKEPYKNYSNELAIFTYYPELDANAEYKLKVTARFGLNSNYTGKESLIGYNSVISSNKSVETKENYVSVSSKNKWVENDRINDLLNTMQDIVNGVVIPALYVVLSLTLIIKGTLLGVAIVKNADNPELRLEKIKALKWFIVGIVVAYAANTVIGVLTGFFKNL